MHEDKRGLMKKVGFISLGCPKNLVDSEVMMGQLKQNGYEITADAADADTVVVNTCGFIDSAKKESIEKFVCHIYDSLIKIALCETCFVCSTELLKLKSATQRKFNVILQPGTKNHSATTSGSCTKGSET